MQKMKSEYITPVTSIIELAVRSMVCQSIQQYLIVEDAYDNDSD